jgi:hypothetical protein
MSGDTSTENRRTVGRPPQIQEHQKQRIVQAYKVHRSYRIVGELCNVSHQTVANIIKEYGMSPRDYPKNRVILDDRPNFHEGSFGEWMYKHDFAKLPRSMKEIAYISGHSYNAVATFFSRNRKRIAERLHNLPTLYGKGLVVENEQGKQFLIDELDDIRYFIDKFSMSVTLQGTDLRGAIQRFTIEDLAYFEETVKRLDVNNDVRYSLE